jgi:hypothetical protein
MDYPQELINASMGQRHKQLISSSLLRELDATAREFRRHGVRLFIFGSVAETYPASYKGADLDLGYQLTESASGNENIEHKLARRIEDLPTIRPIDLVDFSKVGKEFAAIASRKRIELPVGHA